MKKKTLLLPYALNTHNELVYIENAHKGQKYTCPHCHSEVLLKTAQIPEGEKYHRVNHFAHANNANNHCAESYLHKTFKERCANLIQNTIANNQNINFEWKCKQCKENHIGNLLNNVVGISIEHNLGECRPDIALLDSNGKVLVVIEVVVRHYPDKSVLKYYEDNNIVCLQIKVKQFSDLDIVEDKLTHPSSVNICPNPICKKCGRIMSSAKLVTMTAKCWGCCKNNKIAMIAIHNGTKYLNEFLNPSDFTDSEITEAIKLGVNIKKDQQNRHIIQCSWCHTIVGDLNGSTYQELRKFTHYSNEVKTEYRCKYCIDPYEIY